MTRSVFLITLLVTIIAASQANAQLGLPVIGGGGLPVIGGGGLPVIGGGGLPVVGGGGLPVVDGLLQLVNITGQVSCSPNATAGVNGTATDVVPFADAVVQLICGSTVVGSTTTTAGGLFTILLNPTQTVNLLGINLGRLLSPVQSLLQSLLRILLSPACNLVVSTPLSACNPSLPSTGGLLASPLTLISTLLKGVLKNHFSRSPGFHPLRCCLSEFSI